MMSDVLTSDGRDHLASGRHDRRLRLWRGRPLLVAGFHELELALLAARGGTPRVSVSPSGHTSTVAPILESSSRVSAGAPSSRNKLAALEEPRARGLHGRDADGAAAARFGQY